MKARVKWIEIAAFVGGDNVEMGRVAGRYIAEKLGGKGKLVKSIFNVIELKCLYQSEHKRVHQSTGAVDHW